MRPSCTSPGSDASRSAGCLSRAATHSCESCSRAPWARVRAKAGSSRSSASPARGRPDCSRSCATASPSFGSSRPSADSTPRTTPYFAIRPALQSLAGIGPDDTADVAAARLAQWVDEVAPESRHLAAPRCDSLRYRDGSHRRGEAHRSTIPPGAPRHEAISELVSRAARTPTLLLVEDLHWVDDASAALVGELIALAPSCPWLIVLTRRPGPPQFELDQSAATMHLEPLDNNAALDLVRAAAGDDAALSPGDWTKLVERASGNPLFAIELAQAAKTTSSADALADSVESLVTSKIDTLSARDRLLLREASVLGAVVDLDLLADALGTDDVRSAGRWRPLDDFFVAEDGDRLRFRHAIHQQVAYEGLPYRRRRDMHRVVGEAIRRRAERPDAVSGLLSTHYFRAGAHAEGWEFSRLAGDEARAKYANIEAAEFYRRALESARSLGSIAGEELATVATARGEALDLAGEYAAARRAFSFARKQVAFDTAACAELLRKEGRILEYEGRYTATLPNLPRGRSSCWKRPANRRPSERRSSRHTAWRGIARAASAMRCGGPSARSRSRRRRATCEHSRMPVSS